MFHRFCHAWSARVSPENPLPATPGGEAGDLRRPACPAARGDGPDPGGSVPLAPGGRGVEDRGDYTLSGSSSTRAQLVMTTHSTFRRRRQPAPAILSVHGHWSQGKLAPRVQERNIGMAKLGSRRPLRRCHRLGRARLSWRGVSRAAVGRAGASRGAHASRAPGVG